MKLHNNENNSWQFSVGVGLLRNHIIERTYIVHHNGKPERNTTEICAPALWHIECLCLVKSGQEWKWNRRYAAAHIPLPSVAFIEICQIELNFDGWPIERLIYSPPTNPIIMALCGMLNGFSQPKNGFYLLFCFVVISIGMNRINYFVVQHDLGALNWIFTRCRNTLYDDNQIALTWLLDYSPVVTSSGQFVCLLCIIIIIHLLGFVSNIISLTGVKVFFRSIYTKAAAPAIVTA